MLGLALLIAMVGILPRPESWLAWAASAEGANNAPPTAAGEISEATIADLHAGLNGLAADVQRKIDDDIDITAGSFWYVYDVERARWATDVFGSILTAINVGISTLSQFRNFNSISIAEQLPQIATSGKWLSLGAYVVSLGAIKEAGSNLDWEINGPAYITGIKTMYQRAGEAGSETEFRNSVKTSLQKIVWVRAPQAERDRGVPTITYGTRVLSASIARRTETLKTRLSDQSIDPSALRSATAILKNLHTNMLKSRAGSVEIPVHWQGSQQANDALAMGSIAELRKVQGQLLDQYDAALKQRELTVTVDSAKSAGRAALLHLTFGAGLGLINVQASIPAADSLSWTAVKFAFKTDARSLVAEIPQQMLFSLSSEFSSAWHMVDAALSEVEEMVSWNSSRNTQDTSSKTQSAEAQITKSAPGTPAEQAPVPVGQGSVLKGKSLQSTQEEPSAAENAEDRFQKGKTAFDNKDYVTALNQFQEAAEHENAAAQYRLGDMYYRGIGVTQNKKTALEWMRKAAEHNYIDAQYALGGYLCETRSPEANIWYRKAADQGFVNAQSTLGRLYYYGLTSLKTDKAEAAYWFRKASDNGNVSSMLLLGDMYAKGEGVNQDRSKAEELYRMAVDQGLAPAAVSLANLLKTSERQEDQAKAGELYLKAIELYKKDVDKGDPAGWAAFGLGKTYDEGIGIPQDLAESKKWYRQAAAKGYPGAKDTLARVEAAEQARQQEAERMSQLPPKVLGIKCVGGHMQVEDQLWTMTVYINSTDQQAASAKGRFVIVGQQTLTRIEQQLEARGIPQKKAAAILLVESDKKQATVWVVGTNIATDASSLFFKETKRPDMAFGAAFGAALGKKVVSFSLGDKPEDCNVTELDTDIFDKNKLPHASVQNGELVVGETRPFKYRDTVKSEAAKVQVQQISSALDLYRLEIGRYPTQEESLVALVEAPLGLNKWNGPYLKNKDAIVDPWSRQFLYTIPGEHGDYDLYTFGADNAQGGNAEKQDITNW